MNDRIPAAPSRIGATCVYITRDRHKRLITTWGNLNVARSQIAEVLGDRKFKWLDHQTILTDDDIKIQCHHLEDIMELEDEDLLQPQEKRSVDRFFSDAADTPQPMTRREKRKARVAAAAAAAKPSPTPSSSPPQGYNGHAGAGEDAPFTAPVQMPVDEVARQLGVTGRQIRRAMRALRWAKPVGRWVINEEDLPALRKAIKGAAK